MLEETKRAWPALGKVSYGDTEKEKDSMKFRRSMYITEDMRAGDIFTRENIRSIRLGYGLHPKYYSIILAGQLKVICYRLIVK